MDCNIGSRDESEIILSKGVISSPVVSVELSVAMLKSDYV